MARMTACGKGEDNNAGRNYISPTSGREREDPLRIIHAQWALSAQAESVAYETSPSTQTVLVSLHSSADDAELDVQGR